MAGKVVFLKLALILDVFNKMALESSIILEVDGIYIPYIYALELTVLIYASVFVLASHFGRFGS